jgi:hypothetical protein
MFVLLWTGLGWLIHETVSPREGDLTFHTTVTSITMSIGPLTTCHVHVLYHKMAVTWGVCTMLWDSYFIIIIIIIIIIISIIIISGVGLSPLGTAATSGLLYKPQMLSYLFMER